MENIVNSDAIDLFVCTDTIPVVNENRVLPECEKVVVLSVAELIAEVGLACWRPPPLFGSVLPFGVVCADVV